jgi:hypothetical protein
VWDAVDATGLRRACGGIRERSADGFASGTDHSSASGGGGVW